MTIKLFKMLDIKMTQGIKQNSKETYKSTIQIKA